MTVSPNPHRKEVSTMPDPSKEDLDDVMARLPAIERIKRDLAYRLPESGKPLGYVVLTREQAAELLALCERMR
jgi:hypothetical protein